MIRTRWSLRLVLLLMSILLFQPVTTASPAPDRFLPTIIRPPRELAFTCANYHSLVPESYLFLTTETQTGTRLLSMREDATFGSLSWSPDGAHLLVATYLKGGNAGPGTNTLLLMQRSGVSARTVFDQHSGASIDRLMWSPDQTEVVLGLRSNLNDGPHGALYLLRVNDWQVRPLTTTEAWDGQPAWSPDSQQIAFVSTRAGGSTELFLINRDGSQLQRLTTTLAAESYPSWSPDGTHLAFIRSEQEVVIRDLRTGSETIRFSTSGMPHFYGLEWSPDGQDLLVYVGAPRMSVWLVVNSDTGAQLEIDNNILYCGHAAWAPMRIK